MKQIQSVRVLIDRNVFEASIKNESKKVSTIYYFMKQNTKNILAGFGVATVAGAILFSQSAFAAQGIPTPSRRGIEYTAEKKLQNTILLETKDYATWKKTMDARGKNDITKIITEEKFAQFITLHDLIRQKKYTEADTLRKTLGLPKRDDKILGIKMNGKTIHANGKGLEKKERKSTPNPIQN